MILPRVIVIGGDDRVKNWPWPDSVDVRAYSGDEERGAIASIASGSIKEVYALTKWMGHQTYANLKAAAQKAGTNFVTWTHGMGELKGHLERAHPKKLNGDSSGAADAMDWEELERQAQLHWEKHRMSDPLVEANKRAHEEVRQMLEGPVAKLVKSSGIEMYHVPRFRVGADGELEDGEPYDPNEAEEQKLTPEFSPPKPPALPGETETKMGKKKRVGNIAEKILATMKSAGTRTWSAAALAEKLGASTSGVRLRLKEMVDDGAVYDRTPPGSSVTMYGLPMHGAVLREQIILPPAEPKKKAGDVERASKKRLRYTITAVVEVPIDSPGDLEGVLESIREHGSADITDVEVV